MPAPRRKLSDAPVLNAGASVNTRSPNPVQGASPMTESILSSSFARLGYTFQRTIGQPENVHVVTNSAGKEVLVKILDTSDSGLIKDDVNERLQKTARSISSVVTMPIVEISDVQKLEDSRVAVFISPTDNKKFSEIRSEDVTDGRLVSLTVESVKYLTTSERFIGTKIGDFIVEELIGIGGMAIVFRGRNPEIEHNVAIKILTNYNTGSITESEERIKREASILTKLKHPNIVRVVTFTRVESGDIALITDLESGRNLSEILKAGPLTMKQTREVFVPVFDALDYAHTYSGSDSSGTLVRGILHRDIKPSNILVGDGQGEVKLSVKLIDFGIARSSAAVALTRTGQVVGSERYMPMELRLGRPASPASEVYSLAVTIAETVSGQTINDLLNIGVSMSDFLKTKGFSKGYIDVVLACALNPDPSVRYQDMKSFKKAFEEAMRLELGEVVAKPTVTTAREAPARVRLQRQNVFVRIGNSVENALWTVSGYILGMSGVSSVLYGLYASDYKYLRLTVVATAVTAAARLALDFAKFTIQKPFNAFMSILFFGGLIGGGYVMGNRFTENTPRQIVSWVVSTTRQDCRNVKTELAPHFKTVRSQIDAHSTEPKKVKEPKRVHGDAPRLVKPVSKGKTK